MSGQQYLNKINSDKKKKKLKAEKNHRKQYQAMKFLRNGDKPATQKQIDYIEVLIKNSKKKYDYYYPRDKYGLSEKIAGAFIGAIISQSDFDLKFGFNQKRKAIQAWKDAREIERIEDSSNGITMVHKYADLD